MAGRRTNLAVRALLLAALASGFASFALGTKATVAVVVGHGVVSLGIVLLAPWKTGGSPSFDTTTRMEADSLVRS